MNLANCKDCGRLFQQVTRDICPLCIQRENDDFLQVSHFLKVHKGSTPQEVHESTEVKLSVIYKFIREGRLIAANYPNMTYPCERCNLPIQQGRYCTDCQHEIQQQFQQAMHEEERETKQSGTGYHIRI